jgi:hypothetical protein
MNNIFFIILVFLCFYKPYNKTIINLFNNIFTKIFVVGYIILYSKKNPQLSLVVAVGFLIITHNINKQIIENIYEQKPDANKIIEKWGSNGYNTRPPLNKPYSITY